MQKDIWVIYTTHARSDLRSLDKTISTRIVKKIESYTKTQPLLNAKSLSGVFDGLYRYRIGDCRAIFEYKENKLVVIKIMTIKHRKDAYR